MPCPFFFTFWCHFWSPLLSMSAFESREAAEETVLLELMTTMLVTVSATKPFLSKKPIVYKNTNSASINLLQIQYFQCFAVFHPLLVCFTQPQRVS